MVTDRKKIARFDFPENAISNNKQTRLEEIRGLCKFQLDEIFMFLRRSCEPPFCKQERIKAFFT